MAQSRGLTVAPPRSISRTCARLRSRGWQAGRRLRESKESGLDDTGDQTRAHGAAGQRSAMHRTRTIDYGIVLEGEVYLVLEDSEARLQPGDIVVQRGTNHAWDNRSDAPARMAFILLDAEFAPELQASVPFMALVP